MKKVLYLTSVLTIVCCLIFACIPSVYAEGSDSYYYYSVKITTKVSGDVFSDEGNVYYALHGVKTDGVNEVLDGYSVDSVPADLGKTPLAPNVSEQTNVLVYRSEVPLVGVRSLMDGCSISGMTDDDHQYYLGLNVSDQKPGIENITIIEKMCMIEGFEDGGKMILSDLMDVSYTVNYNAPPVISGAEEYVPYFTTQKVLVKDKDLVSVTVDGNEVEFENGEALISLPGDVSKYYTVIAKDGISESQLTVEMHEFSELVDSAYGITKENVKFQDKLVIQDAIDNILMVKENEPNATVEEKEWLDNTEKDLKDLLDHIKKSQEIFQSESVKNTKDITADNVKPEDKEALEQAAAELEKALKEYGGNYRDDEKLYLEEEYKRVSEALEAIPTPEKDPGVPKTGDFSNITLWSVMFVLSGIALIVFKRKKA